MTKLFYSMGFIRVRTLSYPFLYCPGLGKPWISIHVLICEIRQLQGAKFFLWFTAYHMDSHDFKTTTRNCYVRYIYTHTHTHLTLLVTIIPVYHFLIKSSNSHIDIWKFCRFINFLFIDVLFFCSSIISVH